MELLVGIAAVLVLVGSVAWMVVEFFRIRQVQRGRLR